MTLAFSLFYTKYTFGYLGAKREKERLDGFENEVISD